MMRSEMEEIMIQIQWSERSRLPSLPSFRNMRARMDSSVGWRTASPRLGSCSLSSVVPSSSKMEVTGPESVVVLGIPVPVITFV